jgi:predicted nucleotidyltransferase
MLIKLIEATGHRLAVELVAAPPDRLGLPDTRLGRRLRRHRRAVVELAARRGARNTRVFGSVARGEDTEDSDVDLLVDLDEGVGVVSLAGLCRELAELLGVEVDVVPAVTLKPGVRDSVLAEAIAL